MTLVALCFTQIGQIPTGDCRDCGWLRREFSQCHHNSFFPSKIQDKMLQNLSPVPPRKCQYFMDILYFPFQLQSLSSMVAMAYCFESWDDVALLLVFHIQVVIDI